MSNLLTLKKKYVKLMHNIKINVSHETIYIKMYKCIYVYIELCKNVIFYVDIWAFMD